MHTPSFPGMMHSQVDRSVLPSDFFVGFAYRVIEKVDLADTTKSKGCFFLHCFLSANNLVSLRSIGYR